MDKQAKNKFELMIIFMISLMIGVMMVWVVQADGVAEYISYGHLSEKIIIADEDILPNVPYGESEEDYAKVNKNEDGTYSTDPAQYEGTAGSMYIIIRYDNVLTTSSEEYFSWIDSGNIKLAKDYVAFDDAAITTNTEIYTTPAYVHFHGVNCNAFKLCKTPGFVTGGAAICAAGTTIATQANLPSGNCDDNEQCTDLSCDSSRNILSFHVTGFSSHGFENTEDLPNVSIPEFSTLGIVLALAIVVVGLVIIARKR